MEQIEAMERNSPHKLKEIGYQFKKERSSLDVTNNKGHKSKFQDSKGFHERKMSHGGELPQQSLKQLNYHGSQSPIEKSNNKMYSEASRNIINQTIQEKNNPLEAKLILNQKKALEHKQPNELTEKGGDPSPLSQEGRLNKLSKKFGVENASDMSSFGTFHFQNTQTKGINFKNFESKKFGFQDTTRNQESKPIKALKIQADMSPILQVNQIQ